MKHTFCVQIGLMRFLGRSVVAYANRFSVDRDTCTPFVLIPNNTHKTRFISFVGLAHVFRITNSANITKIAKSVIGFNSVNVVNHSCGPTTSNIKPSKAMCSVDFTPNTQSGISSLVNVPRNIASFNSSTWSNLPNKNTSFHAVIKYFSQLFCGNIGLAHLSSPVLSLNVNTGITK